MTRRPLKNANLSDIRAAVYGEGPLRHEYQKEPGDFVIELCERVAAAERAAIIFAEVAQSAAMTNGDNKTEPRGSGWHYVGIEKLPDTVTINVDRRA